MNNTEHYYESLNLSYQLPSSPTSAGNNNRPLPLRKAPLPPTTLLTSINNYNNNNTGTLSHYQNDCMGIPFVLHPRMTKIDFSFQMPKSLNDTLRTDTLEYDFNLEREILCSTKDEKRRSNNPFF